MSITRDELAQAVAADRARFREKAMNSDAGKSDGMLSFRVDPLVKRALKLIARQDRRHYSELAREAVNNYLEYRMEVTS